MSDFIDKGGGWMLRKDTTYLSKFKKMKDENRQLKEQFRSILERINKIEEQKQE